MLWNGYEYFLFRFFLLFLLRTFENQQSVFFDGVCVQCMCISVLARVAREPLQIWNCDRKWSVNSLSLIHSEFIHVAFVMRWFCVLASKRRTQINRSMQLTNKYFHKIMWIRRLHPHNQLIKYAFDKFSLNETTHIALIKIYVILMDGVFLKILNKYSDSRFETNVDIQTKHTGQMSERVQSLFKIWKNDERWRRKGNIENVTISA